MNKLIRVQPSLVLYDFIIFVLVDVLLYVIYQGAGVLGYTSLCIQSLLAFVIIFGIRKFFKVYRQIWRYGGIQCYITLLFADTIAFFVYLIVELVLPIQHVSVVKLLAFCCMNALGALSMRMMYRYAYKFGSQDTRWGMFLRGMLSFFAGGRVFTEVDKDSSKINIAIIGAGTVGVGLADDLLMNPKAQYVPKCFVDANTDKVGRNIHGLCVFSECDETLEELKKLDVDEVVFSIPGMDRTRKLELFDYYKNAGFKIKVFDYPAMDIPGRKRQVREFNIADLLFRQEKEIIDERTISYYRGKTVLITGGGGSIGSELCRQLVKMDPERLVIVDIYENNAYDLQQGLLFAYKGKIDIRVEIVSITNKKGLNRVFEKYRPDICINAAAHKHVPLMENNIIEAVENNVMGTLNVIRCCEEYGCNRFMMVSTDKAVNPTNVMGATKRMCEMIMQAYSTKGTVKCSATRFGNVLGSAGSVIPLFKRQIAAGGPVTVTDKRIIRYFMTIPEASQLVLVSGAMANNGDLFVLDMGKPVKIWDLASNMIYMSGVTDIEIVETGLRPGEKLFEELLVKSDDLEKTDNDLIFIEHEEPVTMEKLEVKLKLLEEACSTEDEETVRKALSVVVPTYRTPDEVNSRVAK